MATSSDLHSNATNRNRQSRDRDLFDAMAAAYCRKDLLPASRRARQHRLAQTVQWVPLANTSRVLEVGCGAGFTATYLQGRYGTYVGIDQSGKLIELARTYNSLPGVTFQATPVEVFNVAEPFDLVLMIGALHHMPQPERVLAHVVTLLKPGGWVAMNEPQSANPAISWMRILRKRLSADYSDEQDELSAQQLTEMFREAGLKDTRFIPQGLWSTPFAEVVLHPIPVARVLIGPLCGVDAWLEKGFPSLMRKLAWNLIAVGRRP